MKPILVGMQPPPSPTTTATNRDDGLGRVMSKATIMAMMTTAKGGAMDRCTPPPLFLFYY